MESGGGISSASAPDQFLRAGLDSSVVPSAVREIVLSHRLNEKLGAWGASPQVGPPPFSLLRAHRALLFTQPANAWA